MKKSIDNLKLISAYNSPPLEIGVQSDWKKSLLIELIDKGQGAEVIFLLNSVGLSVKERAQSPWFVLVPK